jgi:hypothetical protein
MNAKRVKSIRNRVKSLMPANARATIDVVARKVRRYRMQWKRIPSDAQIRRWFGQKVAPQGLGATMPIKQPPKPHEPWYRRWAKKIIGRAK